MRHPLCCRKGIFNHWLLRKTSLQLFFTVDIWVLWLSEDSQLNPHRQSTENSSLFPLEEFVKWDGFYESSVDQLLWQSTHELFIPHWELYTLMSHFNVQRISKPHCGVALWWSTSFCIVHISLNALFYVPINCLWCKSTARLYDLARCAVTQVSFFLLIKLMNIMVPSYIYIIHRKCINKMFVAS